MEKLTAPEILAKLDPEQRIAVEAPIGPVRIIAGAGTGKTRTLIHRIAYWNSIGIAPSDKTSRYPEKQLNEIIAKFHPDTAALRRHMIEYGILERNGASVYWVSVNP
jgi:superfamily I DNA/RNA helicase